MVTPLIKNFPTFCIDGPLQIICTDCEIYTIKAHSEAWPSQVQGQKHGTYMRFADVNVVLYITEYRNNLEHGERRTYRHVQFAKNPIYDPLLGLHVGKLLSIDEYEYGQRNGRHVTYLDNQVWTTVTYTNGERNGYEYGYHSNGNTARKTPYNNGQKHGIEFLYYENGRREAEITWQNDKKQGSFVKYYKNGQLREATTFENDRMHGECDEFDEEGNLLEVFTVNHGFVMNVN
jgi:antitoxin component YwqK of YwqJK toxin-antitoxin module